MENMWDREVQPRVGILHDGAGAIDKQKRELAEATAALRRENDKLARMAAEASRRVKEIGNVQNWAELLEKDFNVLEETLRLVREGSAGGSAGGDSRSSRTCSTCSSRQHSRSRSGSRSRSVSRSRSASASASARRAPHAQDGEEGDTKMAGMPPAAASGSAPDVLDKGKGRADGVVALTAPFADALPKTARADPEAPPTSAQHAQGDNDAAVAMPGTEVDAAVPVGNRAPSPATQDAGGPATVS
jgi:hypothetical protein